MPVYFTEVENHLLDEILNEQYPYHFQDKEDGEYCIGYAGVLPKTDDYLILNSLETRIFYQYPFDLIQKYMERCAGTQLPKPVSVQILQVMRKPGDAAYFAVNKTHYLREFQRRVRSYLVKSVPHIYKPIYR